MIGIIKKLKDPGSAITHFIAMIMTVFAAIPLTIKAFTSGMNVMMACLIFIISMVLLYGASTIYHSFDLGERINKVLKKLDHAMIFVLIAGSYTPVCIIALKGKTGIVLLSVAWAVAILGIIFKLCWINCPKWLSSAMYIAMGWMSIIAVKAIFNSLSFEAFWWLLIGGIIYTVGGVIYAIKTPRVNAFNLKHRYFGTHEIFHIFVMVGSICHFVLVYGYLA